MATYTEEQAQAQIGEYKNKIRAEFEIKYLDLISSFVEDGLAQARYTYIKEELDRGLDDFFSLAFACLNKDADVDRELGEFEEEYERLVDLLEEFQSELIKRAGKRASDRHAHFILSDRDEKKLDNLTQAIIAYIFETRRLVKEFQSST
jgi:hypothetical protein